MADTDYSSLREAVNRIMGAPAGGIPDQGADVALAPKTSYSQDLQTVTPTTTTSAISNTPFDPFAAEKAANAASLAALKTQTDQLAAQVAPAAPTFKASDEAQLRAVMGVSGASQQAIDQTVAAHKAAYQRSPSQGAAVQSLLQEYSANARKPAGSVTTGIAPVRAGINTSAGRPVAPPINPGAKAPWQQSQQYWKDLAAYRATQ